MNIRTKRLTLKPYEIESISDYHSLMSNSLVWIYSTNICHEGILQSEQKLNELIQRYDNSFIGFHALFEKNEDTFIGEAGILSLNNNANRCVIGYNLLGKRLCNRDFQIIN